MKILRKLQAVALERAGSLVVEDFAIGVGLVGVKLSDGSCGVAYNLRQDFLGQCEEFSSGRGEEYSLLLRPGMKASDFVKAYAHENPIARSLGLATINALLNRGDFQEGDVLEFLNIRPGCRVGMIGEIGPIAMQLMARGCDVLIFERNRRRSQLSDWAITTHLESCDVVIISASSLANWTIEWVIDYVSTEEVAIVGPSASMVRGIFPVKVIGGTKILNADGLLNALSKGIGTAGIYSMKLAKKVNLIT